MCPLLSDGSRLFYCAQWDRDVYQTSTKGGESVLVSLQTKGFPVDLSRDGTEFLVCRYVADTLCGLWAEPLLGASPRRLGDIVATSSGAWSPDGQQVAYVRDKELHLAARDGTEIRKLATFSRGAVFLHWSPDGRRISASVFPELGHPWRLWEVWTDGKGARQVLPDWNPSWDTSDGVWTPDGKYFIFISQERIWVLREKGPFLRDGGAPVELNIGLLTAQHPLPSIDGKRVYFEGQLHRNEFLGYDLKLGGFSPALAGISGTDLEFSKDGKWITYVSVPQGTIFRAAADGSQRVQLTWPPLITGGPRWSPDGKEIAFSASVPGRSGRIYIVPAEGGSPRQVTNGEAGLKEGDIDPSWSPDGASLAFGRAWTRERSNGRAIHVVDVKTGRVSTLPGSDGMWSPRWSPDGHFIAGLSRDDALDLYETRTQTQIDLPSPGGSAGYPNWSPDGEFLYFRGGDLGWWRVRIRDRKEELVNSLKDISVPGVWGWEWFAFAPNNSLITARSTGTGDVYALDWEVR
jgi:Tol biopolymer transport system component